MKKLILSLLALCYIIHSVQSSYAPTEKLLKKAYCVCQCCNKDAADTCYKHPSVTTECTEEDFEICKEESFCERWHQQKCIGDCFCRKCKDSLPASMEYKCQFFTEVPEGCECDDDDTIECPSPEDENVTDSSVLSASLDSIDEAAFEKKKEEILAQGKCLLPCYCNDCGDSVPSDLIETCTETARNDECDCAMFQEKTCDKQKESVRFVVLKDIMHDKDKMKTYLEKLKEARGVEDTTDKEGVTMKRKCQLKCVCNKCSDESPFLGKSCKDLEKEDELSSCPPCVDEEVYCPSQAANKAGISEMKCKFKCLCQACGEDVWARVPALQTQCNIMQDIKSNTPCECSDDVKCPYNKENMKKYEEMSKKEKAQEEVSNQMKQINADFAKKRKQTEKKISREAGKSKNTSSEGNKADQVKCKFQCMCNNCDDLALPVKKMCTEQAYIPNCGECEATYCPKAADPEKQQQNMCNIICLCQECKDHRDLKGAFKDTCKKIQDISAKVGESNKCDCDAADVDCSKLGKMKKKLKALEEESKNLKNQNDDSPKVGKMKEKVKLWDEL